MGPIVKVCVHDARSAHTRSARVCVRIIVRIYWNGSAKGEKLTEANHGC